MRGILGKKLGMTRIFNKDGQVVPVTVINVSPCVVTAVKKEDADGYRAVQLGYEDVSDRKLNKPQKAFFQKNNIKFKKYLREIKSDNIDEYKLGQVIHADIFKAGDFVDVSGTTIGKGFSGGMKRHGFSGGGASHGSMSHRQPASAGSTAAARTFKGKRSPGRLGGRGCTSLHLEIIRVDKERGVILVRGSVPGSKKSLLLVKQSRRIKKG